MTSPFNHTHDFDLEVWNSLNPGIGRLIDIVQKGCESSIHDHVVDLCVTMVRWMDYQIVIWVTSDVRLQSDVWSHPDHYLYSYVS